MSDIESTIDLKPEDFDAALRGFTPASIRNVPLHAAGEIGWEDIGGLTDIKDTLIETLQWPAKVFLFVFFINVQKTRRRFCVKCFFSSF